jgi:hypothetical protein
MSLRAALGVLLQGGKCYHMTELVNAADLPTACALWRRAEGGDDEALLAVLEGFVATLDIPCCSNYARLAGLFPEAKVVLSLRDSPEAWVKSMQETVVWYHPLYGSWSYLLWILLTPTRWAWVRLLMSTQCFGQMGNLRDAENMKRFYVRHNERVRATLEPGHLLEFNVKQGWAPLCAHLGVAVPDQPFPQVNDSKERQKRYNALEQTGRVKALFWATAAFMMLAGRGGLRT